MSKLSDNAELYGYLEQNYSTTHYRFEKILGHSFPYKKLDLNGIKDLKLDGISDLTGVDELTSLEKLTISGVSDLSPLENCPSLSSIKCDLPDQSIDTSLLARLSKKTGMASTEFYGRGVGSISSEQALQFDQTSKISYDSLSQLTPEQFSKVQGRLAEVQSLITPEMTDVQKVETIYRNLLSTEFQYDYGNHSTGSNGYLINNTMYGPLVENKGVCSGISSALETALKNAGLDAHACGGWANTKPTAGDSHQWTQVKVDGEWYNLDLTNDYDKKSWRFFMKSDKDRDWAECHYADKEDKYENVHDCTSTKYDEIYREDQKQRELRELKHQKEMLQQHQINSPLSNADDQEYTDYRNKVNQLIESKGEDEYLKSSFTIYKNEQQQDRCQHTIESVRENENKRLLSENDFEYSEKFRKGMLEPSITDFSRRSPISTANVTSVDENMQSQTSTQQTPTLSTSGQNQNSNVDLISENNNFMSVNNIDTTYAQQIQQQAPQIAPDVYQQQMAQQIGMQQQMGGPQLTLTMGGMGGFVNTLLISLIIGFVFGLAIWLVIIFIN